MCGLLHAHNINEQQVQIITPFPSTSAHPSIVLEEHNWEKFCPKTFTANSYHYELIKLDGNLAIFKCKAGYEVHVLRWKKQEVKTIKGKEVIFKEGVRLASNEEFGKYAWSFPTLELCETYIEHLKKQR